MENGKLKTDRYTTDVPSHVGDYVTSNAISLSYVCRMFVVSLLPVQLTGRQLKIREMTINFPRVFVKDMSLALSLIERIFKRDLSSMQKMGVLL